jgi:hypothetical protein
MPRLTIQALLLMVLLGAGAARIATAHAAPTECRGSRAGYSWEGPHAMSIRLQVSRTCLTPTSVPRPEVVTSMTCRNGDRTGPRTIGAYPTAVLSPAAHTFTLRGTGVYQVGGIAYGGTPVTLTGRFVAHGIRATLAAPRCLDAGPLRIFLRRVR